MCLPDVPDQKNLHYNLTNNNFRFVILTTLTVKAVIVIFIFMEQRKYLSRYLTNLMHKICFTISFISRLYMFRAHVLETCRGVK